MENTYFSAIDFYYVKTWAEKIPLKIKKIMQYYASMRYAKKSKGWKYKILCNAYRINFDLYSRICCT